MNMLREKNPKHVALVHYDDYKALVGSFAVNDIIVSCLQRFFMIDVIYHSWNSESEIDKIYIPDKDSISLLSRIFLISFGTESEQAHQLDMEILLQYVQNVNNLKNEPIPLSDLVNFTPSENIKSSVENMLDFFSEFS
jgi:hypothetical protein